MSVELAFKNIAGSSVGAAISAAGRGGGEPPVLVPPETPSEIRPEILPETWEEGKRQRLGLAQRLSHLGLQGLLWLLVATMLGSALAVIYTKHVSRELFAEYQSQLRVRDQLNVEWGRLQLEQATLAMHGRVERIARSKLDMVTPSGDMVMVIRP